MPSRSSKSAWQETWLWKTLEKRAEHDGVHASEFLPTVTLWMRKLDTVLRSGGTVPLDFTLHDADHALRVAHRMEELVPDSVRENLSDYELALLLLAAYGHDIGMTPERGKVAAHHRHLFTPDQSALNPEEKERFQKFLDEHSGQAVALPLTSSLADLNLADELVAYYVRDRHNDWSAEWLRECLRRDPDDGFSQLPHVVEVLVTLCSSHHWDFAALADSRFEPFTVGSGREAQIIHLRYLACILRLADILENDPGRTPEVLFRHRGIAERGKSLVHWQKDHDLSITLGGDQLYFQARPRNARVHRALVQLADWIDHELHGIAAFGERLPAEFRGIKRHWHLTSALIRDIRPFDGSYEYIDGAFRPDTARLLQLLSGEQLYGNPLHAVRELLQNAFDAVREKIARKRLDLPDPADRKWEETLGNQEHVTLTLRPNPDGGWQLVCEDSGVGLNKELITNHVLVSGTGRRHAIRQLERDCEEKGFSPGLTGQFGIGVLSYFMLADEVTLETTRYQGCEGRSESWHFTTRGVGSFGELRKLDKGFPSGGTRVTWGLRRDRVEDPDNPGYIGTLGLDLLFYLQEALVRIPCRFTLRREEILGQVDEWSSSTGWVKTAEDFLEDTLGNWELEQERLQGGVRFESEADRTKREQELVEFHTGIELARSTMRCEFNEIRFDGFQRVIRLALLYFDLPEGRSLKLYPRRYRLGFEPRSCGFSAWKGLACAFHEEKDPHEDLIAIPGLSVEVDLLGMDVGAIEVNRTAALLSEELLADWKDELESSCREWVDQVLGVGETNYFHELNLSCQRRPLTLIQGCGWFHADAKFSFLPLQRPLALIVESYGSRSPSKLLTNSVGESVTAIIAGGHQSSISGCSQLRVVVSSSSNRQKPCLYWDEKWEGRSASRHPRFPTEWSDVALVKCAVEDISDDPEPAFLNPDHPVLRLFSPGEHTDLKAALEYGFEDGLSVLQRLEEVSSPEEFVSALLALAYENLWYFRSNEEECEAYRASRSTHLLALWNGLAVECGHPVEKLRIIATRGMREIMLDPVAWTFRELSSGQSSLLPPVIDDNFLLYEVDEPA